MTEETNPEYEAGKAFLEEGSEGSEDYFKAAKKFLKGAYQNHRPSQTAIALMYVKGKGVPRSLMHAWAWASIACSYRNEEEAGELEKAEQSRDPAADSDSPITQAYQALRTIQKISGHGTAYGFGHGGSSYTEGSRLAMEIYQKIHKWKMSHT